MPNPPKRRKAGVTFSWHPTSFEGAKSQVDLARGGTVPLGVALAQAMARAIGLVGSLECPSPTNDPQGSYRVGLDARSLPVIERQDASGRWVVVP